MIALIMYTTIFSFVRLLAHSLALFVQLMQWTYVRSID